MEGWSGVLVLFLSVHTPLHCSFFFFSQHLSSYFYCRLEERNMKRQWMEECLWLNLEAKKIIKFITNRLLSQLCRWMLLTLKTHWTLNWRCLKQPTDCMCSSIYIKLYDPLPHLMLFQLTVFPWQRGAQVISISGKPWQTGSARWDKRLTSK